MQKKSEGSKQVIDPLLKNTLLVQNSFFRFNSKRHRVKEGYAKVVLPRRNLCSAYRDLASPTSFPTNDTHPDGFDGFFAYQERQTHRDRCGGPYEHHPHCVPIDP